MLHRFQNIFLLFIIASLVLVACAPAAAWPTAQVVVQTQVVTQVVDKTTVVEKLVTGTPASAVYQNGRRVRSRSPALGLLSPFRSIPNGPTPTSISIPPSSINYQGIGSGGGKKAIVDGTVDYAGSDSLVTDAEYTAGKDLQMYPMVAGPLAFIYNLEGAAAGDPALVLDRETLVGIYNGTIKTWNDPAIVSLNPDLAKKLPAKTITVAHRSDGSGTTEIMTNALSSFSADWKTESRRRFRG